MTGSPPEGMLDAALDAWAEAGRVSRVRVEGESMQPLLQPGDCVVVAHRPPHLRRGDLLAYLVGGRMVVHRLVGREGGCLLLAGDNRPLPDAPVSAGEIVGRVVSVEYGAARYATDSLPARALGWALALLTPLRGRRRWRRLPRALAALGARLLRR